MVKRKARALTKDTRQTGRTNIEINTGLATTMPNMRFS